MNARKISQLFSTAVFLLLRMVYDASGQEGNEQFIHEVVAKYTHHTSISCDVDYSIKCFDCKEFYHFSRGVQIIRNRQDSVFGALFCYKSYDTAENFEKYYDLNALWFTDHNKKTITRFDAHKGQKSPITGSFDGAVIRIHFIKPESLLDQIKEEHNKVEMKDTLINSESYLGIYIQYPDESDLQEIKKDVYINRRTKTIEHIHYSVKSYDQIEISDWNIRHIRFDGFDSIDLKKNMDAYKLNYTVTDYKPKSPQELAPLEKNTKCPAFTGKKYPSMEEVSSTQFAGKIIILDFWYVACYYCTQSIPSLNRLYEKYKDDIIMLGLNPFDGKSGKAESIPDFIKRNNPLYQIILINESLLNAFKIQGFPTLYVVDQSGVIRHVQRGYADQMEKELDEVLTGLIKK